MPSNLLRNLTQSGALNVYNPMESYQKALAVKSMKSNLLSGEMNQEAKGLELFKSYLKQAETLEDYNRVKDHVSKMGVQSNLLPEFDSDEEFKDAQPDIIARLGEGVKAQQGKPFAIHNTKTGSELKITQEKYNELVENGMLIADEWGLGTKPDKPEKPAKKAFQRKTREEEIDGFMVKTDYDFDPATGKEIPKKVYFSGAEPSQTQVEKFEAMLDASSPEMKEKYTGKLAQWLLDKKKAGAPTMTQMMGMEKFDIQKDATAGELRQILTTTKDDKDSFEANASQYNKINTKNEVAYWDLKDEWYGDEKTKIIKLSDFAIEAGWTPKMIQEAATKKSKTVKEVLQEIGVLD